MSGTDRLALVTASRSRDERAGLVERPRNHSALAPLNDHPRPGRTPKVTPGMKAWLISLPCEKAKEDGYPRRLWMTRLLPRHARHPLVAAGHRCFPPQNQGAHRDILAKPDIKAHRVRYHLERRDPNFAEREARSTLRHICVASRQKLQDRNLDCHHLNERDPINHKQVPGPRFHEPASASFLASEDLVTASANRHSVSGRLDYVLRVPRISSASSSGGLIPPNESLPPILRTNVRLPKKC